MNFSKSFFQKNFFNTKNCLRFLNHNTNLTKLRVTFSNKFHLTHLFYLNRLNSTMLLANTGINIFHQKSEESQAILEDNETTIILSLDNLNIILGRSLCVSNGKVCINTDQLCLMGKSEHL
jgi:hypothetical protein